MVIVKIFGGLGNQLFQYAFARSIVIQKGYKVKYDISYYENTPIEDTKRELFIKELVDETAIATEGEINRIIKTKRNIVTKFLKRLGLVRSRIKNETLGEILDIDEIKDDTYIIGYWQSEVYFKNISNLLKSELDFSKRKTNIAIKNVLQEIANSEYAVSVHVRGGDYLEEKNQKLFGNICTPRYYEKSFEYIQKMFPNAKFFIFSNDIEWSRKNIKLPYDKTVFVSEQLGKQEDWVELYLMSKCRINIIANSSYSWWSAWLNLHENKVVISPSRWSNGILNETVMCREWIRINGDGRYV